MRNRFAIFAWLCIVTSASLLANEESRINTTSECVDRPNIQKFIQVGGIEQWITIKGEKCSNPVILFLHGGPGNPESIYADSMYREWEGHFTIVHWDQRGAGKTYGRNPEPTHLNIDIMVEDGLEVAKYLSTYLNKKKIILVGASWGSILGVYMIHKQPELFYAYVGTSQAGLDQSFTHSYKKTMSVVQAAEDQAAVLALKDLGEPPWANPRNFGRMRRVQRPLEAAVTDPSPRSWVVSPFYDTPEYRKAYIAGEDFSYIQYIGLKGDGFSGDINADSLGFEFQIPVYLIQGEKDLLTTSELSKRYFDNIVAPDKAYFLLPKVGHAPNKISHEANYKVLLEKVLPLTKE